MAKGFDTLHIKSAIKNRNKFDLSRTHLTTMNFGQIVPLFVEETVPGDKFNVSASYFSRMAPLVKPTYGKIQFKTMTAFVPYHQVADDADAWINGQITWESNTTYQRSFTKSVLAEFIVKQCTDSAVTINGATVTASSANTDVTYVNSGGTTTYALFTEQGKYWVKVLNALGYAIPFGIDFRSNALTTSWIDGATKLSAYPLLAFFKAYNDYMSQSQRYNISPLTQLLRTIKHMTGSGTLTYANISTLFLYLKLNYENDYFISAWQNPNAALDSAGATGISTISAPYNSSAGDSIISDVSNTRIQSAGSAGYSSNLSQRTLDFLRSFDSWVRRNNYSGSRAVQQIYSRFGIKTDDYRTNYAHVLDTDTIPVQVGDVTATAQDFVGAGSGNNVQIGDYAGKGIVNGDKHFEFSADDYGLLMVLGWYTVTPMNAYGFDRRVLRNSPMDYYTPEFDGLGAEAISYGELFVNPTVARNASSKYDNTVYGFTERYNSYRYGRDVITGEFRDFKADGDMNVWHTGRLLTDVRENGQMTAQSSAMNTIESEGNQYNRIFSETDTYDDKFYMTAQFGVSAIRPMLNLNQVVQLGEGDTAVPRNGNTIS